MRGDVVFNQAGVDTHVYLDSITNIRQNGSTVSINIDAASQVYNYTATDSGSAERIVQTIKNLIAGGSQTTTVIQDYATGTITVALLYYDPLYNGFFVRVIGTNLSAASYVDIGLSRFQVDSGSSSPTELVTKLGDSPEYGDLAVVARDSNLQPVASLSTPVSFHYTINSFLPNPFTAGTDDFVVNGKDFDNATLGTVWVEDEAGWDDNNGGHCPATWVDQYTLSCPAADWNPGDGVTTPPLLMYYKDSDGKMSNCLYVASI